MRVSSIISIFIQSLPTHDDPLWLLTVISVTSSFQDHVRNTRRSFSKTILFATDPKTGDVKVTKSLPQDVSSDIQATLLSPSRTLTAILRETSNDGTKKRFVEIWSTQESRLVEELEVTSLHGSFYGSCMLTSFELSYPLFDETLQISSWTYSRLQIPLFLTIGERSGV